MTAADFSRWLNHPAGQLYRRYLAEYGQDLRAGAAQMWEAGQFEESPPLSGLYRGRVTMLREIEAIRFADIELFYRQLAAMKEDEAQNAAKRPAQD